MRGEPCKAHTMSSERNHYSNLRKSGSGVAGKMFFPTRGWLSGGAHSPFFWNYMLEFKGEAASHVRERVL